MPHTLVPVSIMCGSVMNDYYCAVPVYILIQWSIRVYKYVDPLIDSCIWFCVRVLITMPWSQQQLIAVAINAACAMCVFHTFIHICGNAYQRRSAQLISTDRSYSRSTLIFPVFYYPCYNPNRIDTYSMYSLYRRHGVCSRRSKSSMSVLVRIARRPK